MISNLAIRCLTSALPPISEGIRAIETHFAMAEAGGIIPPDSGPLFPDG
jgi:hypothetical protein